jgi:hypothetical protein
MSLKILQARDRANGLAALVNQRGSSLGEDATRRTEEVSQVGGSISRLRTAGG